MRIHCTATHQHSCFHYNHICCCASCNLQAFCHSKVSSKGCTVQGGQWCCRMPSGRTATHRHGCPVAQQQPGEGVMRPCNGPSTMPHWMWCSLLWLSIDVTAKCVVTCASWLDLAQSLSLALQRRLHFGVSIDVKWFRADICSLTSTHSLAETSTGTDVNRLQLS